MGHIVSPNALVIALVSDKSAEIAFKAASNHGVLHIAPLAGDGYNRLHMLFTQLVVSNGRVCTFSCLFAVSARRVQQSASPGSVSGELFHVNW